MNANKKKLNGNNLPKYIERGGEGGIYITKLMVIIPNWPLGYNDSNGEDWPKRQTLNPKVEQFNIFNLDIGIMRWWHVWIFDNLLCETLMIKVMIGCIKVKA
jgi:hypothetical protein